MTPTEANALIERMHDDMAQLRKDLKEARDALRLWCRLIGALKGGVCNSNNLPHGILRRQEHATEAVLAKEQR